MRKYAKATGEEVVETLMVNNSVANGKLLKVYFLWALI